MTRDEIKARHAVWAAEYAAGDSTNIIAKRYGVATVTVLFALRGLGVTMRKGGCSPTVTKARAAKFASIVQLRVDGASTVEAARAVGVSASTVRKFARVAGLKRRSSGRPSRRHPRLDDMGRDYAAGDSLKTLAARYAVDFSHISRLLRNAGVTMRSRGKPRAIDHEAVIAAYASGRKTADVAREFGISVSAVSHIASAAGVRHYPRPKP